MEIFRERIGKIKKDIVEKKGREWMGIQPRTQKVLNNFAGYLEHPELVEKMEKSDERMLKLAPKMIDRYNAAKASDFMKMDDIKALVDQLNAMFGKPKEVITVPRKKETPLKEIADMDDVEKIGNMVERINEKKEEALWGSLPARTREVLEQFAGYLERPELPTKRGLPEKMLKIYDTLEKDDFRTMDRMKQLLDEMSVKLKLVKKPLEIKKEGEGKISSILKRAKEKLQERLPGNKDAQQVVNSLKRISDTEYGFGLEMLVFNRAKEYEGEALEKQMHALAPFLKTLSEIKQEPDPEEITVHDIKIAQKQPSTKPKARTFERMAKYVIDEAKEERPHILDSKEKLMLCFFPEKEVKEMPVSEALPLNIIANEIVNKGPEEIKILLGEKAPSIQKEVSRMRACDDAVVLSLTELASSIASQDIRTKLDEGEPGFTVKIIQLLQEKVERCRLVSDMGIQGGDYWTHGMRLKKTIENLKEKVMKAEELKNKIKERGGEVKKEWLKGMLGIVDTARDNVLKTLRDINKLYKGDIDGIEEEVFRKFFKKGVNIALSAESIRTLEEAGLPTDLLTKKKVELSSDHLADKRELDEQIDQDHDKLKSNEGTMMNKLREIRPMKGEEKLKKIAEAVNRWVNSDEPDILSFNTLERAALHPQIPLYNASLSPIVERVKEISDLFDKPDMVPPLSQLLKSEKAGKIKEMFNELKEHHEGLEKYTKAHNILTHLSKVLWMINPELPLHFGKGTVPKDVEKPDTDSFIKEPEKFGVTLARQRRWRDATDVLGNEIKRRQKQGKPVNIPEELISEINSVLEPEEVSSETYDAIKTKLEKDGQFTPEEINRTIKSMKLKKDMEGGLPIDAKHRKSLKKHLNDATELLKEFSQVPPEIRENIKPKFEPLKK